MMSTSFLSFEQIAEIGFANVGENVLLSARASFYGAKNISIGSNVRIDDFCLLSGKVIIRNYVHISAYTSLFAGDAGIVFEDYTGISSHCSVYAVSDDYTGRSMTNPTIPDKYKPYLISKQTLIGKYSNIGTSCVLLPGTKLNEGVAVAPMSLCNSELKEWSIYSGIPAKRLVTRSKSLLDLEKAFLQELAEK